MARSMEITADISVEGKKELEKALKTREGALAEALVTVVEEVSRAVQSEARTLVPVDTGKLRDSVSVSVEGLEGEVFVGKHYGQFIEFGTSSRKEHPFMGPAAEKERSRMKKRVTDEVKKAVE